MCAMHGQGAATGADHQGRFGNPHEAGLHLEPPVLFQGVFWGGSQVEVAGSWLGSTAGS